MSHSISSADPKVELAGIPIIPPKIFFGSLLLGGVAEAFLPTTLGLPGIASIVAGAVTFAFGFAVMYVGFKSFRRAGTSERHKKPTTMLVTTGIYTLTRNPMYLGFVLIAVAAALAFQSLWLLGSSCVTWAYLAFVVIPQEERYLTQLFGDSYVQFMHRTRRWI